MESPLPKCVACARIWNIELSVIVPDTQVGILWTCHQISNIENIFRGTSAVFVKQFYHS